MEGFKCQEKYGYGIQGIRIMRCAWGITAIQTANIYARIPGLFPSLPHRQLNSRYIAGVSESADEPCR